MKLRLALIASAAFALSGIAFAQTAQLTTTGAGIHTSAVPLAPFSAEITSDLNRVLADGNRIHEQWQEKHYRDSEGRTRNERIRVLPASEKAEFSSVNIHDPIQRVDIFLDQRRKIATVHHFPESVGNTASALPRPAGTGVRAVSNSGPRVRNLDQATTRTDPDGRIVKTEKLGSKEIDGLSATGTKTTVTIPAGLEGNSEAIVVVREWWFSQELRLELQSTNDDPRSGQTTRSVENLQRGDPDPLLFQIPADYTVKDDKVQVQTESGAAYDAANPTAK